MGIWNNIRSVTFLLCESNLSPSSLSLSLCLWEVWTLISADSWRMFNRSNLLCWTAALQGLGFGRRRAIPSLHPLSPSRSYFYCSNEVRAQAGYDGSAGALWEIKKWMTVSWPRPWGRPERGDAPPAGVCQVGEREKAREREWGLRWGACGDVERWWTWELFDLHMKIWNRYCQRPTAVCFIR